MNTTTGIYWLASYPKSGNTWFRIALANLLRENSEPIDLNEINTGSIASSRPWIDDALGYECAELDYDEIDHLRPSIYEWHAKEKQSIGYHKIHDAYTYLSDNKPLIPTQGCLGALYFIRNPLDVAISFANHSHCSIDKAIGYMANPNFAFCDKKHKQHQQVRQWLLTWSEHVKSWVRAPNLDVLVLRYEDMKRQPLATFTKAFEFLQLKKSQDHIEQALQNAQIEKLQAQEAKSGFREKPAKVARFFRKGIVDDWQTTLSEAQINSIISSHRDIMQQFGYLDEHCQPIPQS